MRLGVLDLGMGNLHSVLHSLRFVGAEPELITEPSQVASAEKLIVPGQGAFSTFASAAFDTGLADSIREYIAADRPFLGICLGMQLLFDESEEHGTHAGLGIIPGKVVRFSQQEIVPHMGWNTVTAAKPDPVFAVAPETHFYFVHSYYCKPTSDESVVLTCKYGDEEFCCAVRHRNAVACQFHPEKSQKAGLDILRNFLTQ